MWQIPLKGTSLSFVNTKVKNLLKNVLVKICFSSWPNHTVNNRKKLVLIKYECWNIYQQALSLHFKSMFGLQKSLSWRNPNWNFVLTFSSVHGSRNIKEMFGFYAIIQFSSSSSMPKNELVAYGYVIISLISPCAAKFLTINTWMRNFSVD